MRLDSEEFPADPRRVRKRGRVPTLGPVNWPHVARALVADLQGSDIGGKRLSVVCEERLTLLLANLRVAHNGELNLVPDFVAPEYERVAMNSLFEEVDDDSTLVESLGRLVGVQFEGGDQAFG